MIDFTTDPLVALFFACQQRNDAVDDSDGALIALRRKSVTHIDDPFRIMIGKPPAKPEAIHLVKVPAIDSRIAAQRAVFVYAEDHLSHRACSESGIGNSYPATWPKDAEAALDRYLMLPAADGGAGRIRRAFPRILTVIIPAIVKPEIRRILKDSHGITAASIYPDFPAFGAYYAHPREIEAIRSTR